MNAYRTHHSDAKWASQSFVIRSSRDPVAAVSLQVMRSRSLYGATDKRGWTVWLALRSLRFQVGTR
jgi:hypothetical protein